jgi:thioredoxin-dependent peroxiredoxin
MFERFFSDPLPTGTPAPDFTLLDDAGNEVRLSALRGKNVVLVFYPGDDTPGCTRQLCQLRDSWEGARARGVEVLGVNPQSADSHAGFRRHHRLPFPLLVDAGRKVASLYNANGIIVRRTVYLIGPDGVIRFARRGMPSPAEVLEAVGS